MALDSVKVLMEAGASRELAEAIVKATRIAVRAHYRILREHPEYAAPGRQWEFKREMRKAIWGSEARRRELLSSGPPGNARLGQ